MHSTNQDWREKAKKDFDIPEWYFNLPFSQGRKLDEEERFLEISSKFVLSSQSEARDENGVVEGIYGRKLMTELAKSRGEFKIVENLGGNEVQISQAIRNDQLRQIGLSPSSPFLNIYSALEAKNILPPLLLEKDFDSIYKIAQNKPTNEMLGLLSFSKDSYAFSTLQSVFPTLSSRTRAVILIICAGSGNIEDFSTLYFQNEYRDKYEKAFLERAYFLADENLISLLEGNGSWITANKKIEQLDRGYGLNPKPIEVYQILNKILIKDREARKEKLLYSNALLCGPLDIKFLNKDVDTFCLLYSFNKWTIDEISTELFNVEIVRFNISQLIRTNSFVRHYYLSETSKIKKKIFEEFGFGKNTN